MSGNFESGLKGLLLGDGLSRQNGVERLTLTTPRRINRYQILTRFSFDNAMTTFPEPYVHAFPEKILKLSPGDDCEWFYFSALASKSKLGAPLEWEKLSQDHANVRARLGTKTALRNLNEGMSAPESGHDNPHYFDSIAMLRAAAIAASNHSNQVDILSKVDSDASQTHALDGIWCAKAIATLIHVFKESGDLSKSINKSLEQIPSNTLSMQIVSEALEIIQASKDDLQLALDLEEQFIDRIYCYPYSAPELLALVYASLWRNSEPQLQFSTSFLHRRHNDSLPALMGFLLGFIYGDSWLPQINESSFQMDGICIPQLKGKNLLELI